MANFIVSFRIEEDSSYQERYASLKDKVKQIATGYVWEETTSVYILQANGTATSVASELYYGTKLSGLGDMLLVVDPLRSQYAGYSLKYPALLSAAIGMEQTA